MRHVVICRQSQQEDPSRDQYSDLILFTKGKFCDCLYSASKFSRVYIHTNK